MYVSLISVYVHVSVHGTSI